MRLIMAMMLVWCWDGGLLQYVASIYFTTTFATGTGFGDIVPITPAEQIFVTCLLLVSATGYVLLRLSPTRVSIGVLVVE
jgi:hypothetical protein